MKALLRALFSLAVVAVAAAVLVVGWNVASAPTTEAGLFVQPALDLQLSGERGVRGFVGGAALAPGDVVRGTLTVSRSGAVAAADTLDLDLDLRTTLAGRAAGAPRLDDELHLVALRWGGDDLLSSKDGGRDLVREVDRNPVLGDRDGRLSLREAAAGMNDLPAPLAGGTRFEVALRFDEDAGRGVALQRASVDFVFRLGDRMDGDLN